MVNEIANRFTTTEEIIGEWDWDKKERCIVCNLYIRKEEKIGRCPHCNHPAHLDHFQEWIKIKGACPVCKKNVKDHELKQK